MEILPSSYIDIRLEHTPGNNEPGLFNKIMTKCLKKATKAGFKNTFTDEERELIGKIARGLNIEQEATLYE